MHFLVYDKSQTNCLAGTGKNRKQTNKCPNHYFLPLYFDYMTKLFDHKDTLLIGYTFIVGLILLLAQSVKHNF